MDDPVGVVFNIKSYSENIIIDEEADRFGWFTKLPKNTHEDQDIFILENIF